MASKSFSYVKFGMYKLPVEWVYELTNVICDKCNNNMFIRYSTKLWCTNASCERAMDVSTVKHPIKVIATVKLVNNAI